MTTFSIITPTFNRAGMLSNMIESVRKQTYSDWELIIVDDGSTDNTVESLRSYLNDARIKLIKKHNSGAAHSRNIGADHANGKFITFLDSDDEVKENWLELVSETIQESSGMVCVGAIRKFSDNRTVLEKPYSLKLFSKEFYVKFTAGSLFIKKEIFNAVNGYDVELLSNHHTDLGYRLLIYWENHPFKISKVDKCLIQINVHEGARIRTNWEKVSLGTLTFVKKHNTFLKKHKRDFLSNSYSVIAHSFFKLNNKANALSFTAKAIKYRPLYFKNYLRFVRYLIK